MGKGKNKVRKVKRCLMRVALVKGTSAGEERNCGVCVCVCVASTTHRHTAEAMAFETPAGALCLLGKLPGTGAGTTYDHCRQEDGYSVTLGAKDGARRMMHN